MLKVILLLASSIVITQLLSRLYRRVKWNRIRQRGVALYKPIMSEV